MFTGAAAGAADRTGGAIGSRASTDFHSGTEYDTAALVLFALLW